MYQEFNNKKQIMIGRGKVYKLPTIITHKKNTLTLK